MVERYRLLRRRLALSSATPRGLFALLTANRWPRLHRDRCDWRRPNGRREHPSPASAEEPKSSSNLAASLPISCPVISARFAARMISFSSSGNPACQPAYPEMISPASQPGSLKRHPARLATYFWLLMLPAAHACLAASVSKPPVACRPDVANALVR